MGGKFFFFLVCSQEPASCRLGQVPELLGGGKDFSKGHLPCFLGGGGHDSGTGEARSPVPPCPIPTPAASLSGEFKDEGPSEIPDSPLSASWRSGCALLRWILEIPHGKCSFLGLNFACRERVTLKKKNYFNCVGLWPNPPTHLPCLTVSILCSHILFGYFVWSFKVL